MGYNTSACSWKGQVLVVQSLDTSYAQGTLKQKNGVMVRATPIFNRGVLDKILSITVALVGTVAEIDTARALLVTNNDGETGTWSDGVNDGTFVMMPDSLSFTDVAGAPNIVKASFTLVSVDQ